MSSRSESDVSSVVVGVEWKVWVIGFILVFFLVFLGLVFDWWLRFLLWWMLEYSVLLDLE